MLIKIDIENDKDVTGNTYAQNLETYELIIEVERAPACSYEEVVDIPQGFMQIIHPGKFGMYMDMETIAEVSALKQAVGERSFDKAKTLGELRLMGELVNTQLALVELYEEVQNA